MLPARLRAVTRPLSTEKAFGRASGDKRASRSSCRVWTRPSPDKNDDFIKPSYVPRPSQEPVIQPYRREDAPLYAPTTPEFKPAELPGKPAEMPEAPKMPDRPRDPIPAGNPKEKPQRDDNARREAPPSKEKEASPSP